MLIVKLFSLIKKYEIEDLDPIKIIHWVAGRFDLAINKGRSINIHCGDPYQCKIPKDVDFYLEAARYCSEITVDSRLRAGDIIDRFKAHGKLWLVLKDGRVIDESSTRIYPDRCRHCKRISSNPKDIRLTKLLGCICFECIIGVLSEDEQSTLHKALGKSGIGSRGYRVHYDPISGLLKPVFYESDRYDRDRATYEKVHNSTRALSSQ